MSRFVWLECFITRKALKNIPYIKTTEMITVKVTYTVKSGYVQKNKENINVFMNDFKKLDNNEFRYTVYLSGDGKTFVHLSNYNNEAIQKQLLDVPSFKAFQQQRDESGLEGAPHIDILQSVAASREIIN